MKENIMDRAVDLLKERGNLVRKKLHQQYKSTKPFRMKPLSSDEALDEYMNLTPDRMNELISNFGEDEVGQMVMEMEKLKEEKGYA